MWGCVFYVVCDSRYFPGLVGLIDSLRLVGHQEPLVVLDCGLEPGQRRLLEGEVRVITASERLQPEFLKWVAPLQEPADVMVLLDADVLVVRSVSAIIELAAAGKVVAFADVNPHRFDDRWGPLLGLGRVSRRTYVNTGFIALPRASGIELLGRLQALMALPVVQPRVGYNPFKLADQDVFNAAAGVYVSEEQMTVFPSRLAATPPFRGLRVVDAATLECRYEDGEQPYLIHHLNAKPWLERTVPSVYSRLLSTLLLAPDARIPFSAPELPSQLRPGLRPAALRSMLRFGSLATKAEFKLRLVRARAGTARARRPPP